MKYLAAILVVVVVGTAMAQSKKDDRKAAREDRKAARQDDGVNDDIGDQPDDSNTTTGDLFNAVQGHVDIAVESVTNGVNTILGRNRRSQVDPVSGMTTDDALGRTRSNLNPGVFAPGDIRPGFEADALVIAGLDEFEQENTEETGLGPGFNDVSCAACHPNGGTDGRISQFFGRVTFNNRGRRTFNPLSDEGGPVRQIKGTTGFSGEVIPNDANRTLALISPPVWGRGLFDEVDEDTLLFIQRQRRLNGFPLGTIPRVTDHASGDPNQPGKFGWKGVNATILSFCGQAYNKELGISFAGFADGGFDLDPIPNAPDADFGDDGPDDEDAGDVEAIAAFVSALAIPSPSSRQDAGEQVYIDVGCANCHIGNLRTRNREIVRGALTDLMLWNLGTGNQFSLGDDGNGTLFRTPPLAGLRFRLNTLMHDGQSNGVINAIRRHGGQAANARNRWFAQSAARRQAALRFMNSR